MRFFIIETLRTSLAELVEQRKEIEINELKVRADLFEMHALYGISPKTPTVVASFTERDVNIQRSHFRRWCFIIDHHLMSDGNERDGDGRQYLPWQ
jgi:hypothetical protein